MFNFSCRTIRYYNTAEGHGSRYDDVERSGDLKLFGIGSRIVDHSNRVASLGRQNTERKISFLVVESISYITLVIMIFMNDDGFLLPT